MTTKKKKRGAKRCFFAFHVLPGVGAGVGEGVGAGVGLGVGAGVGAAAEGQMRLIGQRDRLDQSASANRIMSQLLS